MSYFSSLFAAPPKSEEEVYTCPGGATIPKKYLCDGYKDCRDNSDEQNCPAGNSKLIIPNHSASSKMILTTFNIFSYTTVQAVHLLHQNVFDHFQRVWLPTIIFEWDQISLTMLKYANS